MTSSSTGSYGDIHSMRIWDAAIASPVEGTLSGHTDKEWVGNGDGSDWRPRGHRLRQRRRHHTDLGRDRRKTPIGDALTGHSDWVRSVAFGQIGGREVIVSGSDDATIRIWDATRTPIENPLTGHTGEVTAVAIGRLGDHDVVVSAHSDGSVQIIYDGNKMRNATTC